MWGHLPDSGWFGLLWVTGVSLSQSVSRPGLELPVRAFGKLCVSVCVCVSDLWTSLKFVCGSLYSHPPPSRGGVCVCVCVCVCVYTFLCSPSASSVLRAFKASKCSDYEEKPLSDAFPIHQPTAFNLTSLNFALMLLPF